MSYGFQFTTSAGDVIVDETYKNMGMRQKTSFSLTAGSEYDVTYTGDYPLIAINSNCSAGIIEIFYSGTNTTTWRIRSASTGNVTVYVFAEPAASTSTYGMKIFNSSSVQVFNTDNNYLRVVDVFACTYNNTSRPTVTRTYSTSATYAVIMGWPRLLFNTFSTPVNVNTDGITCTSTSVTVANNINATKGGSSGWANHTGYSFSGTTYNITVDVTGY